jgi:V/A-type H+-transporting ATPase subunit K
MNRRYWVVGLVLVGLVGIMGLMALAEEAKAEEGPTSAPAPDTYRTPSLAIAAALAVGISIAGAAYAVAKVGSAALGAITEKPELMGRTVLFIGLAEGLGVLGFAIAVMLWLKL